MANGNKVGELLRNKGTAMETVEDPVATAAAEGWSSSGSREDRIREAAYAASERRGFAPGHETDDWLQAEREVDSAAASSSSTSSPSSASQTRSQGGSQGGSRKNDAPERDGPKA